MLNRIQGGVRGERADAGWLRNRLAPDSGCFRDHHVRAVTAFAGRWIGGSDVVFDRPGAAHVAGAMVDSGWKGKETRRSTGSGGVVNETMVVCQWTCAEGSWIERLPSGRQRETRLGLGWSRRPTARARKERNAYGKRAYVACADTEAHDGGAPGGRDASMGARELRVSRIVKRRSRRRAVNVAASGSGSRDSHRCGTTSVEP
jgi:hypothetical protein